MSFSRVFLASCIIMSALAFTAPSTATAENWPNWRGPTANGVAPSGNPPITWSETENIKWKVAIPGKGSSTPVIWGDKIFLQTAIPTVTAPPEPEEVEEEEEEAKETSTVDLPDFRNMSQEERRAFFENMTPEQREAMSESRGGGERGGQGRGRGGRGRRGGFGGGGAPLVPTKFNLVCLDRNTGETLWEKTAIEATPHEGTHGDGTHASYSPVTDGNMVWASFGSRGLYAFDMDGNVQWQADLIKMETRNAFGEGSSPAIAGNSVVVVADHEGDSKIFAFNKTTGEPLWQKDRDERTSWATPYPIEVDGKMQVVVNATTFVRSYDPETGDVLWQSGGQTTNVIPSPVAGFGNIYCMSGFRGNTLQAIKLGNAGDLTGTDAIAWQAEESTPYVSSPLLYDDKLYILAGNDGILTCFDAKTGAPLYKEERLSGMRTVYASPVGAAGRVYIVDREGNAKVIKQGENFEVLASNTLSEGFDASPVVVGDELFLRGGEHLYCISEL